jgi:hypothetical protein
MTWRSIVPWAALAGLVVGILRDDLFLLIVAAVLLAIWYAWRRSLPETGPAQEADAEVDDRHGNRR